MYTLYSFPAYDNHQEPEVTDGGEIKSSKVVLKENVVLYNKLNVRLSRVWNIEKLNTQNNICSSEFLPIKSKDNFIMTQQFIYQLLKSDYVTKKMVACSTGTSNSQKRITPSSLMDLEVPIPSIALQQQFVSIAEQADKSKFVGFKSQFIEMFGKDSDFTELDKIVEIKDDCRKPLNDAVRSAMKDGQLYPYYGANGVVDYINDYLTDEQLLCIAEDCGNYKAGEDSSYIIQGKAWVNNHAHIVKMKESCSIHYLHQYLKIVDLMPYVSGTTRLKLTQKKLKEVSVLLPPFDKQMKFVSIAEQSDKSKYFKQVA